jgi:S-methyl-5-thioribose-1-phosphate isomerase
MKVGNDYFLTIWMEDGVVKMINQNRLPFFFEIYSCKNYKETCEAIKNMTVRGAGAIGVAAGYAMAQAYIEYGNNKKAIDDAKSEIESTRPTARNLFFAVEEVYNAGKLSINSAIEKAEELSKSDIEASKNIGIYGEQLIKDNSKILTHCNAGWLAFSDYGSALSPIYKAHSSGKKIFVYVDETRPRGQGARLTAWELSQAEVDFAIIPDNAGAYYASKGEIDLIITGADRIASNGDTANKIGTFEKAIVAKAFEIPFYIAAPLSTFDFNLIDGNSIVIEERSGNEVIYQQGIDREGLLREILIASPGSKALNPAFDITPYNYITAFITEKGIFKPNELFKLRKFLYDE